MRKSYVAIAVSAVLVSMVALVNRHYYYGEKENRQNLSFISSENKGYVNSAAESRKEISDIARRERKSIAEIERGIADSILRAREEIKRRTGVAGPGHTIISNGNREKLSPSKIKVVPIGQVVNLEKILSAKGDFVNSNDYKLDESIYIQPLSVDKTSLAGAKYEGYHAEGRYLKGEGYATTEELRSVERTPSGRSGWTGIARLYSDHPELGLVMLRESDNVAAGTYVVVPQSSLNSKVGGYDASLIRVQDGSGTSMSTVQWLASGGRTYSIFIRQTDDASVAAMMRLAEELSHQGS